MLRLLLALLLSLALTPSNFGQGDELTLSLSRDWGYGGPNGRIQGTFSFHVRGPEDVVAVQFFIDDQLVGADTQTPWRYQFNTDAFALGPHRLTATGQTAGGEQLTSNVVACVFVAESESWAAGLRIALPLLLLALGFVVLGALISWRRDRGRVRRYGIWGAAICPNCGRPFGMHWWAPNLINAKYDRCPHCRRWNRVKPAARDELNQAEARWLEQTQTPGLPAAQTEAEKLRKRLEESRYDI
jgi:hypothetical protein